MIATLSQQLPFDLKLRHILPAVCILLIAVMTVIGPAHMAPLAEPTQIVGGNAALCGTAIGFGVVACAALTLETAGFGAALGVSAAIHIAAIAC